ncbi:glycosyltransferase family 9 protein [Pirellulaceae bacterium SH449]
MKIAAILPNWVGDTCMATPTLRAIYEHPDVSELTLIGRRAPLELLNGASYAEKLWKFKPQSRTPGTLGRRQLVRALRDYQPDAIVLFPNSLSSAIIAYLARVPRRIGFARDGRGWLLTDPLPLLQSLPATATEPARIVNWREKPLVDYYAQLASPLGCEPRELRMEIGGTSEDDSLAIRCYQQLGLDPSLPTVVLNNSAATSPSRLWSNEYCAIVAHELANQNVQVIVHSGPNDRLGANEIAASADHPLVQSMGHIDPLPIALSRGVLKSADLVITTDSGIRHMSSALGRRTIVLYGSTSQALTRTYHNQELAVSAGFPCQPCIKSVCPLKHNRCMSDIKPERVLQLAMKQLQEGRLHQPPTVAA